MSLTIGSTTFNFDNPVGYEQKLQQLFSALFDGVTAGTGSASKAAIADSNGNIRGLGVLDAAAVAAGATKTLTAANAGNIIAWDTLGGSVVTLPAATGSGVWFMLYVKTLATSNSHILYCSDANGGAGTNNFIGIIQGVRTDSGNALGAFAAASNSNTITLNRTNTVSVNKGEFVVVRDVASTLWLVERSMLSATGGAFATPFSHT